MKRFIFVELSASRYDLIVYDGETRTERRGIPYYDALERIFMQLRPADFVVCIGLHGIPVVRTGAEYIRMRDES